MPKITNRTLQSFLSNQPSELGTYQERTYRIVTHEPSTAICRRQCKQLSKSTRQLFYYYLNMLPSQLRSRYYSFSTTTQKAIKRAFRSQPLDTAAQAISQLTSQLSNGATKC